ncbi:MAG: NAD(P)/FAD-dependent oxidoreductase [Candidatus Melainabacteria bacterium]|nr:NAD(P)/FAD-dependent oxidoreductase [Candidatus Melainabacteria bacterium]
MTENIPHVVIIGGGFGGLEVAKGLRGERCKITLIDRTNHHLFQPLLYQVAMAAISSVEIAYPIRAILRKQENATVLMAEVMSIDVERKAVILEDREVNYDYLVIAAGSQSSYFGHKEWEQHAIGLKSLRDAFRIRRAVLLSFEAAERLSTSKDVQSFLTFVIIGGGPTGVELAGSLAELSRRVLMDDFRNIDSESAKIILLEGAPRILPTMSERVSELATSDLKKLGVEVMTKTMVTDITKDGVQIGDKFIPSVTKMWCAGVSPSPLAKTLNGVKLDKGGRIIVQPDLSIENYPKVFAVGDIVSFIQDEKPVPGVAPVALQMGQSVASSIRNSLDGKPTNNFRYIDRGSLATIGRSAAVASFGKHAFNGFFAWLAWVFIHIASLIGFRNRMVVMFDWMWSYVTYQRGARLITDHGIEQDVDLKMDACEEENRTLAESKKAGV